MSSSVIQLPETTRQQLEKFQSHVRKIKVAEGILAGLFGQYRQAEGSEPLHQPMVGRQIGFCHGCVVGLGLRLQLFG